MIKKQYARLMQFHARIAHKNLNNSSYLSCPPKKPNANLVQFIIASCNGPKTSGNRGNTIRFRTKKHTHTHKVLLLLVPCYFSCSFWWQAVAEVHNKFQGWPTVRGRYRPVRSRAHYDRLRVII